MMDQDLLIWVVMVATGLANFAGRFSMFSGLNFLQIPNWAEAYLRFVPTSVLSAIVAASLFTKDSGAFFQLTDPRFIAAILACGVALLTRSVVLTIATGLGALWGITHFMG
jgi:branched-subunit amino acid transport protein